MYKFYHKFQHLSSPGRIKSMATAFPFSHWRGSASAGFSVFLPLAVRICPGEARALPRQSHFEAWYQHKFVPLYICPYRPCDSCPSKFPPISPNCCRRNPSAAVFLICTYGAVPIISGRFPQRLICHAPINHLFAGFPQMGHTSPRCSWWKGMQREDIPATSFIFSSQASSPHHMVLMKPPCFSWSSLASSRL